MTKWLYLKPFFRELTSDLAPEIVRDWMANTPSWLSFVRSPDVVDPELDQIQIGEREAIFLAEHIQADFIILDDRKARRIAHDRRLNVIGTIGILTAGAKKGLINLSDALDDLKQTNFRASSELLELLVQQNRE